jgi:5-methylthioadenosine/S-adenosylhomocysteine deaminase
LTSGYNFKYNKFKEAGLTVCLGTDGCASSNNLDMLEAMKTTALLQKGVNYDPTAMPLNELLDCATVNGAKAFRLNTGKIEVGALADLTIIDIDNYAFTPNINFLANLVYSANSSCVDTVICDGKIVMENRNVPGEREILDNVNRLYKKLYVSI